jgi:predicted phosphodiesterase
MSRKIVFRIIHLSDLHLTENDLASRSEARLFGKLKGMNENFRRLLFIPTLQKADLVIVTGDVTDRGDFASWKVFRKAVQDAELTNKIKVLPGNHDICTLGIAGLPSSLSQVKADREKAMRGLKYCGMETSFPWAYQAHKDVVIFGLDSNNAGNLTGITNAVGNIGFFQLEALARILIRYRTVPIKIIALHHSPNIPSQKTARKRYQKSLPLWKKLANQVPQHERRTLRLLALTQGVRIIIHGHLHYPEDRRVNGVRIIGTPSSTQPTTEALGKRQLQFYEYLVYLKSGTIKVNLKSEWLRYDLSEKLKKHPS